jgi:hypothetical protein
VDVLPEDLEIHIVGNLYLLSDDINIYAKQQVLGLFQSHWQQSPITAIFFLGVQCLSSHIDCTYNIYLVTLLRVAFQMVFTFSYIFNYFLI